ncbi:hypothetical protein [Paraliobacillus sp. JSM ZJ581]|uniref:hypothetical protein n=1 Tax=Paraliobacillus sp. JSM ZJ581 TaxID=3342118 RepID=UPI0035A8D6BA
MKEKPGLNITIVNMFFLAICLLLLLTSSFSQAFHSFFLVKLDVHPLFITVIFSLISFLLALIAVLKAKNGKIVIVNWLVVIVALTLLFFSTLVLLFGYFINSI